MLSNTPETGGTSGTFSKTFNFLETGGMVQKKFFGFLKQAE
jgi:hypothetical protein